MALTQLRLFLPAAFAAPQRYQLSLLHVELSFADDFPFVEAAAAQGFALGLFFQGRFFEFDDFAHG